MITFIFGVACGMVGYWVGIFVAAFRFQRRIESGEVGRIIQKWERKQSAVEVSR